MWNHPADSLRTKPEEILRELGKFSDGKKLSINCPLWRTQRKVSKDDVKKLPIILKQNWEFSENSVFTSSLDLKLDGAKFRLLNSITE